MKSDRLKELLEKYYEGRTTQEEEAELRVLQGEESYENQIFQYGTQTQETPMRFDQKIPEESIKVVRLVTWKWAAAAVVLALIVGYALGLVGSGRFDYQQLEMSLASKSTSERLNAVFGSMEQEKINERVGLMLLTSLENDESVNVRLAIVRALEEGLSESLMSSVLDALIKQESPIVQLALIDLIVSNIELIDQAELKKILGQEVLREEAKNRLNHAISL